MVKETRKRRGRALKVKRVEDVRMDDGETPSAEGSQNKGSHAEHIERVAEWKAVKSSISRLKEERKKLGKKELERKKVISKEIKRVMADAITRGLTGKVAAEDRNESEMEM